jgi:hypothetical protein
MKTRFLSWGLGWSRVGVGILIGAVIIFVITGIFVLLVQYGLLTPRV